MTPHHLISQIKQNSRKNIQNQGYDKQGLAGEGQSEIKIRQNHKQQPQRLCKGHWTTTPLLCTLYRPAKNSDFTTQTRGLRATWLRSYPGPPPIKPSNRKKSLNKALNIKCTTFPEEDSPEQLESHPPTGCGGTAWSHGTGQRAPLRQPCAHSCGANMNPTHFDRAPTWNSGTVHSSPTEITWSEIRSITNANKSVHGPHNQLPQKALEGSSLPCCLQPPGSPEQLWDTLASTGASISTMTYYQRFPSTRGCAALHRRWKEALKAEGVTQGSSGSPL